MIRKSLFAFLVAELFLLASPAQAQRSRHGDTWTFGNHCRLTWNAGGTAFTATQDPAIDTNEGSSSYSDPTTGDLLVYSDGISVWDSAGNAIASDLTGDPSSMHSSAIVPNPSDPDHVFVFANPVKSSTSISYREFDITNGVVTTVGDLVTINLPGVSGEGMLAVQHDNGSDYWILVNGQTNVFVIPVTAAGVGTPTATPTSQVLWAPGWGVFTISHDRSRLVVSENPTGEIAAWDFDASTGQLSNKTVIEPLLSGFYYGGEFSPDGTKVYFTAFPEVTTNMYQSVLYQHNFATSLTSVVDVRPMTSSGDYRHGAAKLGPDGRIYVATYNGPDGTLSVIEDPNSAAAILTFSYASVSTGTCDVGLGLPQSPSPLTVIAVRCGDGNVDAGEACDDGDTDDDNACSNTCRINTGFGTCTTNDQCRNPDAICATGDVCLIADNGDGCGGNASLCANSEAVCPVNTCLPPVCGDNKVDAGESCDDGDNDDTNACSNGCKYNTGFGSCATNDDCQDSSAVCGRNDLCLIDDNNTGCGGDATLCNHAEARCPADTCIPPVCGDGFTNSGEACDDGDNNADNECNNACKINTGFGTCSTSDDCAGPGAECGSGDLCLLSTGSSGCGTNDALCAAQAAICRSNTCEVPGCGDNVVDSGEACDDGDNDNTNACNNSCKINTGFGTCSTNDDCAGPGAECGTGDLCLLSTGSSGCGTDDALCAAQASICRADTCAIPACGDGVVDDGEACDDGDQVDDNECSNACLVGLGFACNDASECADQDAECIESICAFPVPDASIPDASIPDAMISDAGIPDASAPDASAPDASSSPDAEVTPDSGTSESSLVGGACRMQKESSPVAGWALLALAALVARRRRR